ncbi:MAG: hypothetical protein P4L53_28140 [Candidatus Obscuribacterales bacterium]|nr:hypothetical protein [Candidatus Obscuribacterales bacterium]
MSDNRRQLVLDERDADIALHALKFYMEAKGMELSENTLRLRAKLDDFMGDTPFVRPDGQNIAAILGARGGTIGGASTSDAKKAAAAANGAKGGRPHKPNLYIKFAKEVWHTPDPKLLNQLYIAIGNNTWLPDEVGDEKTGPYVRVYVPEITPALEKLLKNSMNIFEWDDKPFFRLCDEHKTDDCRAITNAEREQVSNCTHVKCGNTAEWIY